MGVTSLHTSSSLPWWSCCSHDVEKYFWSRCLFLFSLFVFLTFPISSFMSMVCLSFIFLQPTFWLIFHFRLSLAPFLRFKVFSSWAFLSPPLLSFSHLRLLSQRNLLPVPSTASLLVLAPLLVTSAHHGPSLILSRPPSHPAWFHFSLPQNPSHSSFTSSFTHSVFKHPSLLLLASSTSFGKGCPRSKSAVFWTLFKRGGGKVKPMFNFFLQIFV